jgi:hypothetical protein
MMSHHLLGGDMTTDTKAVARWDTGPQAAMWRNDADGDYVYFDDHEQVVAELVESKSTVSDMRDTIMLRGARIRELESALAAKSAEAEGLRLVVNRARHLAAWFSSGNTVPVQGTHVMKISGTSVMDDVYQLNQALDAMEKSNEHQDQ